MHQILHQPIRIPADSYQSIYVRICLLTCIVLFQELLCSALSVFCCCQEDITRLYLYQPIVCVGCLE